MVYPAKRRIYLASFFDTRQRLLATVVPRLKACGFEITSRWLNEPQDTSIQPGTHALRDLDDIRGADVVLVDTLDLTPRGGREWEGGYAAALGKDVAIVGPRRNVFHHLFPNFPSWDAFLGAAERKGGV